MLGRSIPVVIYHHISPVGRGLTISPEIFEDHLRILDKKGWKTLSGEEFLFFLQCDKIPKKCVLISFDDGFADNYFYAYPILKKYNMKALLFVATSFIEEIDRERYNFIPLPHKEAWPLAFTERRSEVMCTWDKLKEMETSRVFDIQSHGHTHRISQYIKEDKYQEIREDLIISKKILEEKLSKVVSHLAWPKGSYNQRGIIIATEVGFKALYTTERGSNTNKNLKMLKRLPVKYRGGRWLLRRLAIYSSELLSKLYLSVRI